MIWLIATVFIVGVIVAGVWLAQRWHRRLLVEIDSIVCNRLAAAGPRKIVLSTATKDFVARMIAEENKNRIAADTGLSQEIDAINARALEWAEHSSELTSEFRKALQPGGQLDNEIKQYFFSMTNGFVGEIREVVRRQELRDNEVRAQLRSQEPPKHPMEGETQQ